MSSPLCSLLTLSRFTLFFFFHSITLASLWSCYQKLKMSLFFGLCECFQLARSLKLRFFTALLRKKKKKKKKATLSIVCKRYIFHFLFLCSFLSSVWILVYTTIYFLVRCVKAKKFSFCGLCECFQLTAEIQGCLIRYFKQRFSMFKQPYTYFYIFFYPHVFLKNINNITKRISSFFATLLGKKLQFLLNKKVYVAFRSGSFLMHCLQRFLFGLGN